MKNSKILGTIFISLLVTGLMLGGFGEKADAAPTPSKITVGYTNYFSGKLAALGKFVDDATQIALEDFNKTAKVPIALHAEDIGDSPVSAKNGVEKLLSTNPKINLLWVSSPQFSGVQQILEDAKIPMIGANTLPSVFEHGWDWIFGVQTTTAQEVGIALKYWKDKLGKSKVVALLPNEDTGKATLAALEEAAKINNVTIFPEFFQPGDNDYSANITRARRNNPDMYYIGTQITADMAKIIKQMKQLGIKETISVNNRLNNKDVLDLLTEQEAEGLYGHSSMYLDLEDPKVKDWAARFEKKFGHAADAIMQMCYDAAMVTFMAAEEGGGQDKEKIKAVLRSKTFEGLGGKYKFDSKGRGRHETNILRLGPNKSVQRLAKYKEAGY